MLKHLHVLSFYANFAASRTINYKCFMETNGKIQEMVDSVKSKENEIDELKKSIRNTIKTVIENTADDCPQFRNKLEKSKNISVIKFSDLMSHPFDIRLYSKARSVSAFMVYLGQFPVTEWVDEIRKMKGKKRFNNDFQFTVKKVNYIISGVFIDAVADAFANET